MGTGHGPPFGRQSRQNCRSRDVLHLAGKHKTTPIRVDNPFETFHKMLEEGEFYANSGCTLKSTCRNNRLIDESYQCSDHATCDTRTGVRKCYCNQNYHGDGVTCTHNCFVADKGSVLMEGEFYANSGCTLKSTCRNNRLIDESYQCSDHATCDTRTGVRKCYCNPKYHGDGVTCTHNCFVADKGSVLKNGEFYANARCTRKSTCRNNRLIDTVTSVVNTQPVIRGSGVRKCYCDQNYNGDGATCTHRCFVADKGSVLSVSTVCNGILNTFLKLPCPYT
ncbi:hypothetical protein BSL78_03433 [Apostichopus japonicus]|uniref:EGF-like domain-containing protein n=1 Tax=Stichopus japonicus TaxID=307972 RepID=A0A2G8LHA5_STIJA|nr:hypothetical protein BSL78_03433 [Apostichopus japonicus]